MNFSHMTEVGQADDAARSVLVAEVVSGTGSDQELHESYFIVHGISETLAQAAVNRFYRAPSELVDTASLIEVSKAPAAYVHIVWSEDPDEYRLAMAGYDILRALPGAEMFRGHRWEAFKADYLHSLALEFPIWADAGSSEATC